MTRSKVGLVGLCVIVFGMMAMSTAAAQAALSWLILNPAGTVATELKAELVVEKDTQHSTLLMHLFLGLVSSITCTNFELVGINLEAGGKLTTGGKVRFTECEAYESGVLTGPRGCHVHSAGQVGNTVETNKLKGELVLHEVKAGETEVLAKIEPEVAGPIATILTNGTCLVTKEGPFMPESIPVNGVFYFKDSEKKALIFGTKHLIELGPLTLLWVGSDTKEHLETKIDGSNWVKLGGAHKELKWSAMDV